MKCQSIFSFKKIIYLYFKLSDVVLHVPCVTQIRMGINASLCYALLSKVFSVISNHICLVNVCVVLFINFTTNMIMV